MPGSQVALGWHLGTHIFAPIFLHGMTNCHTRVNPPAASLTALPACLLLPLSLPCRSARDLWLQGIQSLRRNPNPYLYQSLAVLAAEMDCVEEARKWFREGTRTLTVRPHSQLSQLSIL